jgi:dipeptidase E
MKKMILTSDGITSNSIKREFLRILEKPVAETKVLIIYTLRRKSSIKYVRKVNTQLKNLGIKKKNIYYANISSNIKKPKKDFDVIYSCGGNTFYILDRIKKTGYDKVIKNFVHRGRLYLGVSAGSMIVHKTIKGADGGKEGDVNDIGLKNLKALNLTNIWIWPHFRDELNKEVIEFRKSVKWPVKELRDGEAILILGKKIKKLRGNS